MEILGTKYQTYIDDELVVFRLVNIKSNNKYTVEDKDGKRITMTQEELNKCDKLYEGKQLCFPSFYGLRAMGALLRVKVPNTPR